jgi:hypothetical protein
VSVRGGEEKEREGGWTRMGWRESETDCERRDSEREGREREGGRRGWRESETDCERKGGDRGKGGREI